MLDLLIPGEEYFNDATNEFVYTDEIHLVMEHSLVSLSKWESRWLKPFLGREDKTEEEILDYFKCMTLTKNVKPEVYTKISPKYQKIIWDYINGKHTATTFREDKSSKPNREIITAELIYYWMIANEIPLECEKWNLDRLLTLIRVCNIKNSGDKGPKMSPQELANRNRELNAQRRAKAHSKG